MAAPALSKGFLVPQEKSERTKSSNTKNSVPTTAIDMPPIKLHREVSYGYSGRGQLVKTYIRLMFSTFMAGSRVKVLITRQDTAQVELRKGWDWRKEIP